MRSISLSFLQFWNDVKRLLRFLQLQHGVCYNKSSPSFFFLYIFNRPLFAHRSLSNLSSLFLYTHTQTDRHTQALVRVSWGFIELGLSSVLPCPAQPCWCIVDNKKKKNSTNRQLYTFDGCIIKCPSSSFAFRVITVDLGARLVHHRHSTGIASHRASPSTVSDESVIIEVQYTHRQAHATSGAVVVVVVVVGASSLLLQ